MLFNNNIILEILRSEFSNEIESFVEENVTRLDEYDYAAIFESMVDFAIFSSIDEIAVGNFSVEEGDGEQIVFGIFETIVTIDGFEDDLFVDSASIIFGVGFSFHVSEGKYSALQLEYLY